MSEPQPIYIMVLSPFYNSMLWSSQPKADDYLMFIFFRTVLMETGLDWMTVSCGTWCLVLSVANILTTPTWPTHSSAISQFVHSGSIVCALI